MGKLSCICLSNRNSAGGGNLLLIDVAHRHKRVMFGSELDLLAFFKTFLTVLTWLLMNPLL